MMPREEIDRIIARIAKRAERDRLRKQRQEAKRRGKKPKPYKWKKYNVEAAKTFGELKSGFDQALRHDTD